jgi:FkbM family methyltransferase
MYISRYNSQYHQDEFLDENVFKGYKNGFFMDVGAHDGVDINNTLYFERYNNWSGINVEPIKSVYDKLVMNRPNNININCAVCNNNGTAEFMLNKGYTEMISGLKSHYDKRHLDRLNHENTLSSSSSEIITVNTKTIETICEYHNIKHINYLTIDVEGAEFDVIKSINFNKVFIDVITFENNYDDLSTPIIKYLENNGFRMIRKAFDIFMVHQNSTFMKNVV